MIYFDCSASLVVTDKELQHQNKKFKSDVTIVVLLVFLVTMQ